MPQLIRSLESITTADAASAGTKAAALGELARAQFNVPPGLVLTTAAYFDFIAPIRERILERLTPEVVMDPAEIESAADEIRGWLRAQPFPKELNKELSVALASFGYPAANSFAARTSVPGDDLGTAFGSGVARAFLGLVGTDEIANAAAQGWAAVWNSRAIYYRYRKKIVQTDVALAILVQPMVPAESAGVMFTRDPLNGAGDEIQISSIRGLGAPLTSARLRPNLFKVDAVSGEIREQVVEEQVVKLVVGGDGHTEERAISPELANTPSLDKSQVKQIAELGKRIQEFFSQPQDIEWAIAGDEVFVLQARPIGIRNA